MHFIDFPLFVASVGKIQISWPTIRWSWTGNAADRYLAIRKASEKLSSGLKRIAVALLVFGEMIQDGRVEDETLLGLSDFEDKRIMVSLPQQTSHKGSLSQTRSSWKPPLLRSIFPLIHSFDQVPPTSTSSDSVPAQMRCFATVALPSNTSRARLAAIEIVPSNSIGP
jgi:hypothetical protein